MPALSGMFDFHQHIQIKLLVNSEYCERRLQVSEENSHDARNEIGGRLRHEEQFLIRNFHIKSYLVRFARGHVTC